MLIIGEGTLCLMDGADAAIRSGGNIQRSMYSFGYRLPVAETAGRLYQNQRSPGIVFDSNMQSQLIRISSSNKGDSGQLRYNKQKRMMCKWTQ